MNNTLEIRSAQGLTTLSLSPGQPTWRFQSKARTSEARLKYDSETTTVNDSIWERKGDLVVAAGIVAKAAEKIRDFGLPQKRRGNYYLKREDVAEVYAVRDRAAAALAPVRARIVADYPSILAENQARVGRLDPSASIKWPATGHDLAARFFVEVSITAGPTPFDPILGEVSDEVAARIRAASQAQVEADLRAAQSAPVADLLAEIEAAIVALSTGKRLRTERIEKVASAAERLARLNWLEVPEIDRVVAEIKAATLVAAQDAASLSDAERATLTADLKQSVNSTQNALAALGL